MVSHVPDERLVDVMEGRGAADRVHVEGCPRCRTRLAGAQAGLELADGAAMPEPLPLYWESLRRQLRRRLDEEAAGRPAFWRRVWLGPALAAAAVVVGIVTFFPRATHQPTPSPERRLPAWSALPPADEDEGLDLLRAVAPAVADAAPSAVCGGVAECVAALSDEESQALTERLREAIELGKKL
jgi:hypothetical protein